VLLHSHTNSYLKVHKSTDCTNTFTFINFEFKIVKGKEAAMDLQDRQGYGLQKIYINGYLALKQLITSCID